MSAHTREFLSLYRRLLRLHQRLPQDYATIGTSFLRNEFKNHRSAKDEFVAPFLMEWRAFAEALEAQLKVDRGSDGAGILGHSLSSHELGLLSDEQTGQLLQLRQEAVKLPQIQPETTASPRIPDTGE